MSARVSELAKQNEIKNLKVNDFFSGYTKEEELAYDLNGQRLAAKAGYSPTGMLTLLETFKALHKGELEESSENIRPSRNASSRLSLWARLRCRSKLL